MSNAIGFGGVSVFSTADDVVASFTLEEAPAPQVHNGH
eukprot:SAG31_NODE_4768_length_2967_cov_4.361227_3_plen_38_part_00